MPVTDDIREAAAWVAGQARHVGIREEKVAEYAAFILKKYPLISVLDPTHHFISDDAEKTASYVLALDSINFGSGYASLAKQHGIILDYNKIAGNLKALYEQNLCCRPQDWLRMSAKDCHGVFDVPTDIAPELDSLMATFAHHLAATGRIICDDYEGKTLNLLKAAGGSAVKLVEIVAQWPTFADLSVYKGRRVPFLKRAQILAADLQLAGAADFKDMGELTIFADNMVPHVLRLDGVLEYGADLDAKVDGNVLIPSGSTEEIEMRACAIHAVERIRQSSVHQGNDVTSVNIDHLLWHRGHEPAFAARPPHQTMTVWY